MFLALKTPKPFAFNKSFGLFPRFYIFFLFSAPFPCRRLPLATPFRTRRHAFPFDHEDRLAHLRPHVKTRVSGTEPQGLPSRAVQKAVERRQSAGKHSQLSGHQHTLRTLPRTLFTTQSPCNPNALISRRASESSATQPKPCCHISVTPLLRHTPRSAPERVRNLITLGRVSDPIMAQERKL